MVFILIPGDRGSGMAGSLAGVAGDWLRICTRFVGLLS